MKRLLFLPLAIGGAAVCHAALLAPRETLKQCVTKVFTVDAAKRIVAPGDAVYTDARMSEKIQNEQFPILIAYAISASEVGPLVKCAKSAGVKAVVRSGGHHFESYSALNNTLVIDIAHINGVSVSSDKKTAKVGAGIRLGALYTALDAYDTTFVGGICPTVGIGGLLSSGGFNMQMRTLGISADYVVDADVVLADGTTVKASASSNSDLFWAIRGGGGGAYGIATAYTLRLVKMPRSAMVFVSWNSTDDRYPVAKRFLEWAPKAPAEFTSQVNVYKTNVTVLGWYYGGSVAQVQTMLNASGLLAIGQPVVQVSGNCNTDNSRLFGYTTFECVADDKVDAMLLNVVQDPFSQLPPNPQFQYKEEPKSTTRPVAPPWQRYLRISKSFFVQKGKLLKDSDLREVVKRIGALDDASQIWGEWHAWNISAVGNNAFAWRQQAYAHLEFQVHGSPDPAKQQGYKDWFKSLEQLLRPALGPASYSGYADSALSVNHLTSYYGDNVCKLVKIKKQYDPDNFFSNPQTVPPTAPAGIAC